MTRRTEVNKFRSNHRFLRHFSDSKKKNGCDQAKSAFKQTTFRQNAMNVSDPVELFAQPI